MEYDSINELPAKYKKAVIESVNLILNFDNIDLSEIVLFGSCARLNLHVGSDIDVLIVTETMIKNRRITGSLRGDLEFVSDDIGADVVFATKEHYDNSQERLVQHIRSEGIVLWRDGEFTNEYEQFLCHSKK